MEPIATVKLQKEQLIKLDELLDGGATVFAMWELVRDGLQGGSMVPMEKRPELTEMFSLALQKFLMEASEMNDVLYGEAIRAAAKEVV